MRSVAVASLALMAACSPLGARVVFTDVAVTLPDDAVGLPPGPNFALVSANCLGCHSADMITNQPRLTRAQWQATVTKMQSVYKAPIDAAEVPAIVDYLISRQIAPSSGATGINKR